MKHDKPKWWWLVPCGALVALVLFLNFLPHPATLSGGSQTNFSQLPVAAPTLPAWSTADDVLKNAFGAGLSRENLEALRARLTAMPKAEAVAAIRRFLDGKMDAVTGLSFKIGKHGLLTEAPTFRTFLLDELARIDPAAAADYSKTILASMDSPDEWAVALRNLAQGDPSAEGRALLQEKFSQMLSATAWQDSPSIGYLEAFDVAVYLGGQTLVPPLASLVEQKANPAVANAAYLALDRMVINNPVQTLTPLAADLDSMPGRELVRADYFARLDVRDPQQRSLLESYLLNPQLGPEELHQFAGTYPNDNFMISPNLLTANNTLDNAGLTSRDAASLQVLNQWLADPRFAALLPQLQLTEQRLQTFVSQAAGRP